jgi:hypothetical protein
MIHGALEQFSSPPAAGGTRGRDRVEIAVSDERMKSIDHPNGLEMGILGPQHRSYEAQSLTEIPLSLPVVGHKHVDDRRKDALKAVKASPICFDKFEFCFHIHRDHSL